MAPRLNGPDGAGPGGRPGFDHDPDQNDEAIDRKLVQAQERLAPWGSKVQCVCPREGDVVVL